MKLEGVSPVGIKIQQYLFMKRLTYIKRFFPVVSNMIGLARETNSPFTSWSSDPVFQGQ